MRQTRRNEQIQEGDGGREKEMALIVTIDINSDLESIEIDISYYEY